MSTTHGLPRPVYLASNNCSTLLKQSLVPSYIANTTCKELSLHHKQFQFEQIDSDAVHLNDVNTCGNRRALEQAVCHCAEHKSPRNRKVKG